MGCQAPSYWTEYDHDYFHAGFRCVRNRNFDIEPPAKDDPADFERWRTETFRRVELCNLVDFIQPLLAHQPHRFDHIGMSAICSCGWAERKFWSTTSAKAAWWHHAESLIDFDALENEYVLSAFTRLNGGR